MSSSKYLSGMPIARFDLSLEYSDLQWLKGRFNDTSVNDIEQFEEKFAKRFGLLKAFYVASARAGFYAVLQSLKLPPKSVVLMPAWTHPSMPAMVVAAGHRARIVDITPGTYVISPENIPEAAWNQVKVLLATQMYGCPCPINALAQEAKRRGVTVIEDCAQGFGATVGGKPSGSFGDASCFSFALTKNFTTLSGGMIGVQSPVIADRLQQIMKHSTIAGNKGLWPILLKAAAVKTATTPWGFALGVYPPVSLGWAFSGRDMLHPAFEETFDTMPPSRMVKPAPAQAALGLRMLGLIDAQNKKRHENGVTLLKMLEDKNIPSLGLPKLPEYGEHIFMSFVVTHPERTHLARHLWSRKIDTSPGYLKPVNQVTVLSEIVERPFATPVADRLSEQQLHLPIYPSLQESDLRRIAQAVAWSAKKCQATTSNPILYEEGHGGQTRRLNS